MQDGNYLISLSFFESMKPTLVIDDGCYLAIVLVMIATATISFFIGKIERFKSGSHQILVAVL
jgi:hypothetical protein